jgi:hypothetical protein
VIEAATGNNLVMGGHNDWALDTVFVPTAHLISVSRDRSAKLMQWTRAVRRHHVDHARRALKAWAWPVTRRDEIVFGGPTAYRKSTASTSPK